jgi:hypothetical protein
MEVEAMNPMHIDLSDYEEIASASSDRNGRRRWTSLSLYHKPGCGAQSYVGVVLGCSDVAGEEDREARYPSATLAGALKGFSPASPLTGKIVSQIATRAEATLADGKE